MKCPIIGVYYPSIGAKPEIYKCIEKECPLWDNKQCNLGNMGEELKKIRQAIQTLAQEITLLRR